MSNPTYHPGNYIRVPLKIAKDLIWRKFDVFLCRAGIDLQALRPVQLAGYDVTELVKKEVAWQSSESIREYGVSPWRETEKEDPTRWPSICNRVFDTIFADYAATFLAAARPVSAQVWYYFEHPEAVDFQPLSMAIDHTKEADDWHDRPAGRLAVIHYDSFRARNFHKEAIALLLNSLPRWTVYAPASLMMRATTAPQVSMNTRGMGSRRVYQEAFRLRDVRAVCDFLKIPWFVYFREVNQKYEPKAYRNVSATR